MRTSQSKGASHILEIRGSALKTCQEGHSTLEVSAIPPSALRALLALACVPKKGAHKPRWIWWSVEDGEG